MMIWMFLSALDFVFVHFMSTKRKVPWKILNEKCNIWRYLECGVTNTLVTQKHGVPRKTLARWFKTCKYMKVEELSVLGN